VELTRAPRAHHITSSGSILARSHFQDAASRCLVSWTGPLLLAFGPQRALRHQKQRSSSIKLRQICTPCPKTLFSLLHLNTAEIGHKIFHLAVAGGFEWASKKPKFLDSYGTLVVHSLPDHKKLNNINKCRPVQLSEWLHCGWLLVDGQVLCSHSSSTHTSRCATGANA
jgi:hypothetical protein